MWLYLPIFFFYYFLQQDDVSLSSADTEASEPSAVSDTGMPTGSTDVAMTPTEADQPLDLMHKMKGTNISCTSIRARV